MRSSRGSTETFEVFKPILFPTRPIADSVTAKNHATAEPRRSTRELRERVARHTQFARGLRVCVDTRRHEDVRKARASETGQLHGSRGRCPRAREVRDRCSECDCRSLSFCRLFFALHTAHRSALEPRGGHVPRGDARCGAPACRVRAFLARGVSRVRLDRPAIPTTRTTRQVSLFVPFCTRARGRHATTRGAFLNFDITGAVPRTFGIF